MSFENRTITDWMDATFAGAKRHGWYGRKRVDIPKCIAELHSELSEALECWRDGEMKSTGLDGTSKPEGFGTEIADVVIRCFNLCRALNIDLEAIVAAKVSYNESRPYKHGRKR